MLWVSLYILVTEKPATHNELAKTTKFCSGVNYAKPRCFPWVLPKTCNRSVLQTVPELAKKLGDVSADLR